MILIYAGRRQATDAQGVRERVRTLLDEVRPRLLVGSAAAGADLLVLALARERDIPARVILLGGVAEFERVSVADLGEEWIERYREILADTGVSVESVASPGPDRRAAHLMVNEMIIETARREATEGEEVIALAVTESPGSGGSVTADLVAQAERRGWPVVTTSSAVHRQE
ncbi:hypothetical protein [Streptomyces sp. NBC_01176]|uniref:hypothetical protein n=1 Tax=Streptomyces sp. NBC_01176 TaxID=2903760 RepID=UPI002F90ABEE|nr:hypothetical protein OG199_44085 [Streptomyces sp. NBC_01176]